MLGDAPSTDETPSELNPCHVVSEEGASGIQFGRCFNSTCDVPENTFSEFPWNCVPGDAPSTVKTPSESNSCHVVFEEGASGIQFGRCFNSTCDVPGNTFFRISLKVCSRGRPKYY